MISGTLGDNSGGRYTLDLTARDGDQHASQQLILTVTQPPAFLSGDVSSVVVWTARSNQIPILASGYPAPTITRIGQLQSGISFRSIPGGAALISGSPGVFESPCTSQITLEASNSSRSVTMHLTVDLKNLRCSMNLSTVLGLMQGAFQLGPTIFNGGKAVGQWIVLGGQKVGQFFSRNGQTEAQLEEDGDQIADSGD